jgi:hypothetical protein
MPTYTLRLTLITMMALEQVILFTVSTQARVS